MRHFISRRASGVVRRVFSVGALVLVTGLLPATRAGASPQQSLSEQVRLSLAQSTPAPQPPAASAPATSAPAQQTTQVTGTPLPLSLSEAITRGLDHNLNILLTQAGVEGAQGAQYQALSTLLPDLSGTLSYNRQKISLDQFGFNFPGFPKLIGPFNVYDARAELSQTVVDVSAFAHLRSRVQALQAAKYTAQDARDAVVLAVANLYLDAVAGMSRIEAAEAEVNTAKALFDQATDMKQAGTVAGIDVLRAQVQLETEQQQLIVLRNALAKQKLALARAIGIDPRQPIELSDRTSYHAMAPMSVDDAVNRALGQRGDLLAASALVNSAQAEKLSAQTGRLPTLKVTGNYGTVGQTTSNTLTTYALGAEVHVPIFEGGAAHARTLQAEAELRQRRAQLDDLKRQVQYEVQTALLDLTAADERVRVAQHTVTLAKDTQQQAQDRFRAGVANNLEVVQAQEAVARANEVFISSVYEHNLAKAALARSLGVADKSITQFISGAQQ